ncbi:MAG: antibiotic biosynthesis monooxygenase [Dysgonamonadaceae bacterium]|jgi:quinol monooxygenase YgiN|nr:antibiotic biosynthesis monooxygenase [Dysgonamonadaceae bacterium]
MKKIFFIPLFFAFVIAACQPNTKSADTQTGDNSEIVAPDDSQPVKKTVVARALVKEGQEAAFTEVAKTLVEATRQEPGCLFYSLYQSPFDSKSFIFYEEYTDQAAFDFHAASDHFKAFSAAISEMLAEDLLVGQF